MSAVRVLDPGRAASDREQLRQDARARHPSAAGWRPDRDRLAARLGERLAEAGWRWPLFAASVLAERARRRLDRRAFGQSLGVDPAVVLAAEEGRLPPLEAPAPLARLFFGTAPDAGPHEGAGQPPA